MSENNPYDSTRAKEIAGSPLRNMACRFCAGTLRNIAAAIATPIVLLWCMWFLLGVVGHLFPGFIGNDMRFPATRYWPEGHQVFPSFDLVHRSVVLLVSVTALALLTLQLLAITLRNRIFGFVVGLAFLVLGLPLLCLLVFCDLFPFGKTDPAHDFVWDTVVPYCAYGTWAIAGALMLYWSYSRRLLEVSTDATANNAQAAEFGIHAESP